jgi:hypothetical protein
MAHAKYSPSASERWLKCPGSVSLSLKAPPPKSSKYADEGTEAHKVLEHVLLNKTVTTKNQEMIEHAMSAAKVIREDHNGLDELLVEEKCKMPFIHPDFSGTVDVAIVEEFGTLRVYDYKYGAGYAVNVEENPQMIAYALGIAHKYHYDFKDVEMCIIQPRADHEKGPVRRYKMGISRLLKWSEAFKKGIDLAEKPDAPLIDGSHCKWCPAKSICPQISDQALAQAKVDFAPIESSISGEIEEPKFPVPSVLTPPMLSKVLQAVPKIQTWIEGVETYAFEQLKDGVKIPGFKVVEKRGTRKWTDPKKTQDEAFELIGEAAFTEPELKSPAQLEKSGAPKDWVNSRTTTVSSGETMVPDSDPRPATNKTQSAIDDFSDSEIVSEADWKKKKGKKK